MKINICHDCNAKEGEIHNEHCDMQICPKCKGQYFICDCKHSQKIKLKKEPYFFRGLSCTRCGKFFPDFKMVSDDSWNKICGITYDKDEILCWDCMKFIIKKRKLGVLKSVTFK